jgi:hypothetical protein
MRAKSGSRLRASVAIEEMTTRLPITTCGSRWKK